MNITKCYWINRAVETLNEELDIRARLRWLPHNLIGHPLMAVLPVSWGDRIHDLTTPKGPINE